MIRLRYGSTAAALVLASAVLAGCTSSPGDGKESPRPDSSSAPTLFDGKIIGVGVKKGQPGFSQKPNDGYRFKGFEQSLLADLESRLHFRTRAFDISSAERESLLKDEVVKLVVATYSINPEREKEVDFTAPYLQTPQGVLVRDDDTSIKHQRDLASKNICTAEGSVADPESVTSPRAKKEIRDRVGAESIDTEQDYKTCVRQLHEEKYDAVVTDKIILAGFEEHARRTAASDKQVKVVEAIELRGPKQLYGIALPKGHEADCRKINKALRKLLYSGAGWDAMFKSAFDQLGRNGAAFEYKPDRAEFPRREADSCGGRKS